MDGPELRSRLRPRQMPIAPFTGPLTPLPGGPSSVFRPRRLIMEHPVRALPGSRGEGSTAPATRTLGTDEG